MFKLIFFVLMAGGLSACSITFDNLYHKKAIAEHSTIKRTEIQKCGSHNILITDLSKVHHRHYLLLNGEPCNLRQE